VLQCAYRIQWRVLRKVHPKVASLERLTSSSPKVGVSRGQLQCSPAYVSRRPCVTQFGCGPQAAAGLTPAGRYGETEPWGGRGYQAEKSCKGLIVRVSLRSEDTAATCRPPIPTHPLGFTIISTLFSSLTPMHDQTPTKLGWVPLCKGAYQEEEVSEGARGGSPRRQRPRLSGRGLGDIIGPSLFMP
jgi:hypothetical protein